MATMADVAKYAGVSSTTVSHVINETRYVQEDTRRRVLEAVDALHYRPNAVARGLTTKRTATVGVVVADIQNPFYAALVRGIENDLADRGYSLIVCNTDERPEKEVSYLSLLVNRRVDGIIIAPTGHPSDIYDALRNNLIPMVFIDREPPGQYGPVIEMDNVDAARQAVRHLISHGHRRIAILAATPERSSSTQRICGYRLALQEAGLPDDEDLVCRARRGLLAAQIATERLLQLPNPPTALLCVNETLTLGALAALRNSNENGLASLVPASSSGEAASRPGACLMSFDDTPWKAVFSPRISVVRLPTSQLAHHAVRTLLAKIQNPQAEVENVVLQTELVERESCHVPIR
jgi:LacI family transcriptional regulator